MQLGRETEKLIKEGITALNRNADATEKLVAIATEEQMQFTVEEAPSVCPNCGRVNPVITEIRDSDAISGALDGFVLVGESHCCNTPLYAVPRGWDVVMDRNQAASIVEMKGRSA